MNPFNKQFERDFGAYQDEQSSDLQMLEESVVDLAADQAVGDDVLTALRQMFDKYREKQAKADKGLLKDVGAYELEEEHIGDYLDVIKNRTEDLKDYFLDTYGITEQPDDAVVISGLDMNQKAKLEEYLCSEIYPAYNQQREFISGL